MNWQIPLLSLSDSNENKKCHKISVVIEVLKNLISNRVKIEYLNICTMPKHLQQLQNAKCDLNVNVSKIICQYVEDLSESVI